MRSGSSGGDKLLFRRVTPLYRCASEPIARGLASPEAIESFRFEQSLARSRRLSMTLGGAREVSLDLEPEEAAEVAELRCRRHQVVELAFAQEEIDDNALHHIVFSVTPRAPP